MRKTIVLLLVLGGFTTACSDDDDGSKLPDFATLFPADNAIGNWVWDSSAAVTEVQIATTKEAVEGMINGDADPFTRRGFRSFGRGYYGDGTYHAELHIWQMAGQAGAQEVYDAVVDPDEPGSVWADKSWTDESWGDAGRWADTGLSWWLNARQNVYLVDVKKVTNDAAGKTAATDLLTGVLAKMP